ncbi:hypothetical protein FOZ61_006566 [Perkinsus olseni]|uniref:F-box domain-containing protein n=1 Tax=Perkinsus olseni TaxID=32597 RepID=A0A7J6LCL7_PEROL|nr:hypothetical protein FOZ61_006566 [Perkinsus olseni]
MSPPPIDGLVLEHILPWLMSDVTSAVRMASVCSSWRRAVMDYLRYEGTRTGYGVLNLTLRPGMVRGAPEAIRETYGRYIGEIVCPMRGESGELQKLLEDGDTPNLRTLASRSLHLSARHLHSLSKLLRLDLSFHDDLHDEDLSLCCGCLPHLTELLVQWTRVEGKGWLDDETKRRPWRVLRLDQTNVPLHLVVAVCICAGGSLVGLGFTELHDRSIVEVGKLGYAIATCTHLEELYFSCLVERDLVMRVWPSSSSLRVLCLKDVPVKQDFFYTKLIVCDNLHKLEMIRPRLKAPDEELDDMFRWIGSNDCMRWVDFSGPMRGTDKYLIPFLAGLEAISPAPLSVLKISEWNISVDMLCDLLRSCPNITFLDLLHCPITTDVAAFMHGLLSQRIRRLPDGDVEFHCPVHGSFVAKDGEINDEFVSLLDAGGRIWQTRREPTCGVEIINSFGNLVEAFCDGMPTSRCTAEEFCGGRILVRKSLTELFASTLFVESSTGDVDSVQVSGLVFSRISLMLPPPIDGLVLEHILPWLMSDINSAARVASVCSSWRRAVMDYLRYEETRTGYGVLKLAIRPGMGRDSLKAVVETYGRYTGEIVDPIGKEPWELREVLESSAAPNLRSLSSRSLHVSRRLWVGLPKLVRLDFSFHCDLCDEDLSLCCGSLPHLTELLVQWTRVEGKGWLDDEYGR